MLLLIALTLKGSIAISPTPPPVPPPSSGGGGGGSSSGWHKQRDDNSELREKIQREDSVIIQIVEVTLKTVII